MVYEGKAISRIVYVYTYIVPVFDIELGLGITKPINTQATVKRLAS